ncbi:MAG: hypothetical protein K5843_00670 [Bacteroidales bacterium]|nr:hypothetical protein [Bacteroidales bacterium]
MGFEHHVTNGQPPRIISAETMLQTIQEMGIVPFFENDIPGYSVEEMTSVDNWFDTQENLSYTPWDWKIHCVQSGEIAYGKFLQGKAAFATVEWYAELRNYRRAQDKYKPDEAQRKVLDYLKENGSIGIKEVRLLLGIKKGAADTIIAKLMQQCRVVTGDITRVYRGPDLHYNGWQTSSFCTPEALFDKPVVPFFAAFEAARGSDLEVNHSPEESFRRLQEHIRTLIPDVTEKQLLKLLA